MARGMLRIQTNYHCGFPLAEIRSKHVLARNYHKSHGVPKDWVRIPTNSALGPGYTKRSPDIRKKRCICKAEYEAFPFDISNYHKCVLQIIAEEPPAGFGAVIGTLIFIREADMKSAASGSKQFINSEALGNSKVVVMGIGGESLQCLMSQVDQRPPQRPLSLDLLWSILERGQEISKREWKLLHVAVVSITETTYIGRLFFGDAEKGGIVWDCDCRPSDACWLALKTKCPIYMNKTVWDTCSQYYRELWRGSSKAAEQKDTASTVRYDDPEPVKRLKREMEVALSEEDYTTAARIRDHPFMLLVRRIAENEKEGRPEAARKLRDQLTHLIASTTMPASAEDRREDK